MSTRFVRFDPGLKESGPTREGGAELNPTRETRLQGEKGSTNKREFLAKNRTRGRAGRLARRKEK